MPPPLSVGRVMPTPEPNRGPWLPVKPPGFPDATATSSWLQRMDGPLRCSQSRWAVGPAGCAQPGPIWHLNVANPDVPDVIQ